MTGTSERAKPKQSPEFDAVMGHVNAGALKQELVGAMMAANAEIQQLRGEISRLKPKAEAYDTMTAIVRSMNRGSGEGMGQDLVWFFNRRIDELSAAPRKAPLDPDHTPANDPLRSELSQ